MNRLKHVGYATPPVASLLSEMVRFNTINKNISGANFPEAALIGFLESRAKLAGLKTRHIPLPDGSYNLLITAIKDTHLPWVVFDSHLDTVAVDGMSIAPFSGDLSDGRISGRGSCDTKASGAAMLTALESAWKTGQLRNNIALLFSIDEEVGKTGARAFCNVIADVLGATPVLALVGEPTLLKPVVMHNGVFRLQIQTFGQAAHSSSPHKGRSAISSMLRLVDHIENTYAPTLEISNRLTGKACCTVNTIRGGSQVNIIADRCTIEVDRRIVPEEVHSDIPNEFSELIAAVCGQHSQMAVESHVTLLDPPMSHHLTERYREELTPVFEQLGIPAEPCGAAFSTNGNIFTEKDIPTIVLGPGDIAQAHSDDEWVAVEQLTLGHEVYKAIMCHALQ